MNISGNVRYQFTEELIEKAVFRMLKRRNYDDFNIKEICLEAGVNRSSFYAHYSDINDLMIKIEGGLSKKLQEIWKPIDSYEDLFVNFFSFIQEHKVFYKAFLKSHNPSFAAPEMLKKQKEQFKQFADRKNFNYTEAEIDYHIHWFGGGLKAICGRWIQNDCKEPPREMAKIVYDEYANNAKFV